MCHVEFCSANERPPYFSLELPDTALVTAARGEYFSQIVKVAGSCAGLGPVSVLYRRDAVPA